MKKIRTVKSTIATVLTALVLLTSCKKEKNEMPLAPDQEATKKLKSTTFIGNTTFEYAADGKLKQFVQERPFGTYRYEFVYEAGKVTMNSFDHLTGRKLAKHVLALNQKGHISADVENQFDDNGNAVESKTTNYSYSSDGQLIEIRVPGSFSKKLYYDASGNNAKTEYYNGQNQLQDINYYSYSSLPEKFTCYNMSANSWLYWFLPAKSKNLLVHIKQVNAVTNAINYEEAITYELDTEGYVKKAMVDELSVGSTDWTWVNTWVK